MGSGSRVSCKGSLCAAWCGAAGHSHETKQQAGHKGLQGLEQGVDERHARPDMRASSIAAIQATLLNSDMTYHTDMV